MRRDLLVLPAASSPNISSRISFEPKILPIILDICPPMLAVMLPQQLCKFAGGSCQACDGDFLSLRVFFSKMCRSQQRSVRRTRSRESARGCSGYSSEGDPWPISNSLHAGTQRDADARWSARCRRNVKRRCEWVFCTRSNAW